jgi:hypothetical protein
LTVARLSPEGTTATESSGCFDEYLWHILRRDTDELKINVLVSCDYGRGVRHFGNVAVLRALKNIYNASTLGSLTSIARQAGVHTY